MNKLILTLFTISFLYISCKKEDNTTKENYVIGKNKYKIQLEGVERIYFVHVPQNYSNIHSMPVVIMFHGSGQSGDQFYSISGWKEVGESQNILTVFPSALSYCVMEDGLTENRSKWNSLGGSFQYCSGQIIKDDIFFVKEIIKQLKANFNIDEHRIYTVGFSNGGEFAARTALEMSEVIAASISSGGGGAMPRDTTIIPKRLLPVMLVFGNKDGKLLSKLGLPLDSNVPMGFEKLYSSYPYLYSIQIDPYVRCFKLDANSYVNSGDTSIAVYSDFNGFNMDRNNIFRIAEIKNLEHEYPNGINHPLNGASLNWEWFKQYQLP